MQNTVVVTPFTTAQRAMACQFVSMQTQTLFRVTLLPPTPFAVSTEQAQAFTKDALWQTYLAAFPEGTDPLYKSHTEHDCQCCKSFVRTMGGVVSIENGAMTTIWDNWNTGTFYDTVAAAMGALVRRATIDNVFLHTESAVGVENSFQKVSSSTASVVSLRQEECVVTWAHFFVRLPKVAMEQKAVVGPRLSEHRATHDVLKRGLEELTLDAVDTVLELIAQNSLYRGEEHKHALEAFRSMKLAFDRHEYDDDLFVWSNVDARRTPTSVTRIRNTAIGALLVALSEGESLDAAVGKFEAMVAPANYKRPTALVTKAMITSARKVIEELGYANALERRYAVEEDLTVNNVLFVDRASQPATFPRTTEGVFAALAADVAEKTRTFDKIEEVPVEKFLRDLLPKAATVELLLENRHASNLVSLVAPANSDAPSLFKWHNNFSWSYAGDFADSLREKVKRAGGAVTGVLCCRLAWDYTDDLDLHMREPDGTHIFYGSVRKLSACGGMLDLDANGCDGMKNEPVENIFYGDANSLREGVYELYVHNYSRRSFGVGFEAEVEFDGQTYRFSCDKVLRTGDKLKVVKLAYSHAGGFKILESLPFSQKSKELWGLQTQTFRAVKAITLSPNYWVEEDSAAFTGVGNKHYFFFLEGCRNAEGARGFYNEFLDQRLSQHRKVFELVGSKMRTDEADRQLSGLGFSSTQKASLVCRITGSFTRVVRVLF